MAPYEAKLLALLQKYSVPGASLAVCKHGRLVYARGFGFADPDSKIPVQPHSLFRIASVSKSISAVAALKLVEQQRLSLDDKPFEILKDLEPCGKIQDPRIYKITVRDLLWCTSGWTSKTDGDPMFMPILERVKQACHCESPPSSAAIIRYWMTQPLGFEPGTSWAYSNFGYAVLGEVIARRSGMPYEDYVRQNVLIPMGIDDCVVGKTILKYPNEVIYAPFPGQGVAASIDPGVDHPVYSQYGADFSVESLAAPAGWIASTIDLVRFASCLSGECKETSVLSQNSLRQLFAKPTCPYWRAKNAYFAMGWDVYPDKAGNAYSISKIGGMPGSVSYLVHRSDGFTWAVCFNSRPRQNGDQFITQFKSLIWEAVNHQKSWPPGERL
jgi:CubicO group peptidase (beta-lactamase class C family)